MQWEAAQQNPRGDCSEGELFRRRWWEEAGCKGPGSAEGKQHGPTYGERKCDRFPRVSGGCTSTTSGEQSDELSGPWKPSPHIGPQPQSRGPSGTDFLARVRVGPAEHKCSEQGRLQGGCSRRGALTVSPAWPRREHLARGGWHGYKRHQLCAVRGAATHV